jgi:hypothetical protein
MKSNDIVCMAKIDSGFNSVAEFVIAVVDADGKLHQYAGRDADIAADLIEIVQTGESMSEAIRKQQAQEERDNAMERGDTPEMGRLPEWRDNRSGSRLPIPAGQEGASPSLPPARHIGRPDETAK